MSAKEVGGAVVGGPAYVLGAATSSLIGGGGGGESTKRTQYGLDQKLLDEYQKTGANTALLRSAFYDETFKDGKRTDVRAFSSDGQRIDSDVSNFLAWKDAREAEMKKRELYLSKSKESPGRAQTILVPTENQKQDPNLLGLDPNQNIL